ncbi:hypothetical protein D8B26_005395 [Coccidioides posadasii str. Silveira]|uniref:uncharacterized protein n=1 Tax=Coccidioides posadasii (strain RMSCC 757 / Silveira) TaxID=443226 RepID=UPI001BF02A94|nr:hypothetical protein D8B26_005377 [Coccidioides posadasii str. Silveira]QVM10742.1 hypothetical protein D8B26_005395 [Coccidioides posadasii str. Silveira]
MSSCKHQEWIHMVRGDHPVLEDTGRMCRLVEELPRASQQHLRLIHFLGRGAKDAAIQQLFPQRHREQKGSSKEIVLQLDDPTASENSPLMFAESNPFSAASCTTNRNFCHESKLHPCSWSATNHDLSDIIHARLLFLFCDVICIFADDFPSLGAAITRVESWAEIGSASTLPPAVRPMVMIITSETSGPTADILPGGACIDASFSSLDVVHFNINQRSSVHQLKEEILCRAALAHITRQQYHCLFSALHLTELFQDAITHTSNSTIDPFDFALAARKQLETQQDKVDHLSIFLKLAMDNRLPYDAISSVVASSILMDAYPEKMHCKMIPDNFPRTQFTLTCDIDFDPQVIFDSFYRPRCTKAFVQSSNSTDHTGFQCDDIQYRLKKFFFELKTGKRSAAQIHADNLGSLKENLKFFTSNQTCLVCLLRAPERVLRCGHSTCDVCVRTFGHPVVGREDRFDIRTCTLCGGLGPNLIDLKPKTAGVRIIAIAGGGCRGVVPLETLESLQALLGDCLLNEMFDLAVGTSSGGLIILGIFVLKWSIKHCSTAFEDLLKQCFRRSNGSLWHHARSIMRWLLFDAMYDEKVLEDCLRQVFGEVWRLFGHIHDTVSSTRVAVSTMKNGNIPALMANYNGSSFYTRGQGYTLVRAKHTDDEPFLWEAGRATSAAPVYFKPLLTAGGTFTDGGLWVPNPSDVALQEATEIWPDNVGADMILVLGTGMPHKKNQQYGPQGNSITQLWRSFMGYLDGAKAPRKTESNIFWVDPPVPELPRLDDWRSLSFLRRSVHLRPHSKQELVEITTKLLASSLFFVLDVRPQFEEGQYRCYGSIRCRTDCRAFTKALSKLNLLDIEFVTAREVLTKCGLDSDICKACHRYRKSVSFCVRHPSETISLSLRTAKNTYHNLSGFPQNMKWFVQQQGLDAHFGTHGAPSTLKCSACDQCPYKICLKRKSNKLPKTMRKRTRIS